MTFAHRFATHATQKKNTQVEMHMVRDQCTAATCWMNRISEVASEVKYTRKGLQFV